MKKVTEKRIALITGANRGIGFETARQLGKLGNKVIIGARTAVKGEEAAKRLRSENIDAEFVHLDIDNASTYPQAFDLIDAKFGKLDILINNAGILLDEFVDGAPVQASTTDADVLRRTFDTNFFNTVAVTQKFLPLVRRSDSGRIVFVSSLLASLSDHTNPDSAIYNMKLPAYDTSKSALNAYAVHLAHELRDTPIKVNIAHPGSVLTDMNANGEIPVEEGARTSVELATLPPDGYSGRFVYQGEQLPW